ncbi:kanadaptin [Microcaecilia unicolor]|uniref:Kanadaptin n=1 Tax=Microcaecilia unicolor TaxID=1415580 RepID=A0A6P7XIE9_9AMPH|nr:kanadaptin [Microcaecilia unicolor]
MEDSAEETKERNPGREKDGTVEEPGAKRESGSREPGAKGESGSREPGAKRESGSREPGAKGESGSREPGAKRESGSREPGAKRERGNREPGTKRESGSREPGAKRERGNREPGAKRESGSREPGTKRESGSREPGAKRESGSREPGAKAERGNREPGAKVESDSREPGAKRESGSREPGAKRERGNREPGAKAEHGNREPGAKVESDSREPGAKAERGNRELGAKGEHGSREPGAKAERGNREPGAKAERGSREPGAEVESDGREPGAKAERGNREPGAKVESDSRELGAKAESGNREPGAKGERGSREPGAKAERDNREPGAKVESDSREPGAKAERGNRELGAKGEHGSREPGAKAERGNREPGAKAERGSREPGAEVESDGREPGASSARTSDGKEPGTELGSSGGQPGAEPGSGSGGQPGAEHPAKSFEWTATFKKPVLLPVKGGAPRRDSSEEPPLPPPVEPKGAGVPPQSLPGPTEPYQEPPWAGAAEAPYSLETLKGGCVLHCRPLGGTSRLLFGRLPACDVSLEHPCVSRYHAVLQYRRFPGPGPHEQTGFYLYDLDSTHGTFLNKNRIPTEVFCRVRVGHVMKFGGSSRLFILQGPEDDQEEESELTVTQIKENRRQQEHLQRKMLGDDSDEEENEVKRKEIVSSDDTGCTWGMGEDATEDDMEENPIAVEFQEEREAFYVKDPKKALQGFFDREGEELEYEYEDRGHNSWLCRVRLPVDDATGKQLVAEAVHSGKKKEAQVQCSMEACRILDARGLLRQEAVSRKRKAKNWEDEDFYDSDDDTFLDRTGSVEQKRINRMKKAGKIEDKPDNYDSLVSKLNAVEKELSDVAEKLKTSGKDQSQSAAQDSLDAFMTEIKSGTSLDGVSRKKLHLKSFELKKEQQRLKGLIKIVKPTELPFLKSQQSAGLGSKPRTLALPMFGAMKGGSKFKLKTGTIGRIPPKHASLPGSLFTMKDEDPEEEEEEEEEEKHKANKVQNPEIKVKAEERIPPPRSPGIPVLEGDSDMQSSGTEEVKAVTCRNSSERLSLADPKSEAKKCKGTVAATNKKVFHGPAKPPQHMSNKYPEDDPDYCVWVPPAGQSGDGRTHLNDKYGY